MSFATPFFMPTHNEAIRAFADTVNNRDTTINKHPEDYTLIHLGEIDTSLGVITPSESNDCIAEAEELKSKETIFNEKDLKELLIESQAIINVEMDNIDKKLIVLTNQIFKKKPWYKF